MTDTKNTRGGARPGSGRKMGKEQKVTISFRVTATTRDRIQKLREDGVDINKHLEMMVALLASPKTHREFVCGGPRSGKSFQAMMAAAMDEGLKEETIIIDEDLTKPAWPEIKSVKMRDD